MRDMVVLLNLDQGACCAVAKKLRSEHLYCRVLAADVSPEDVLAMEAQGLVLCGASSGEATAIPNLSRLLRLGMPVLALGDAALTLCQYLGGTVTRCESAGDVQSVRFFGDGNLLRDVHSGERYLPRCRLMNVSSSAAVTIAETDNGVVGFRVIDHPTYALAFQPEQNDPDGDQLLINFCKLVCGCTLWWSSQAFINKATQDIERMAAGGEAVCSVSGGVDSAVCALLGNMALGHRMRCLFVDTGLMRKDESDAVMDYFQNQVGLNIRRINASDAFLEALRGITDAEEKQRTVFALLRSILRREVSQMPDVRLILQGTNFADALTQEPQCTLDLPSEHVRIMEPVRELFKDEIRAVGRELQLPETICRRQPFPGTGLAGRIMGEVTQEKLRLVREADAIFRGEIEAAGQNKKLFQYFATLTDSDQRSDAYVITLRAVQVVGGGSAALSARLPSDLLERSTQRILTALPDVRRVLYDLTPSRSFNRWRSE